MLHPLTRRGASTEFPYATPPYHAMLHPLQCCTPYRATPLTRLHPSACDTPHQAAPSYRATPHHASSAPHANMLCYTPYQARRVARRRVVVMDQSGGCELERLGFTVVKVGPNPNPSPNPNRVPNLSPHPHPNPNPNPNHGQGGPEEALTLTLNLTLLTLSLTLTLTLT